MVHHFPNYNQDDLARPYGDVQLLIGLSQLELLPTGPVQRVGRLGVFESIFGTGAILGGTDPTLK